MSDAIRTGVKSLDEVRRSLQQIEMNRKTAPARNSTAGTPLGGGTDDGAGLITGSNEDETEGYSISSVWVDTGTGHCWMCINATTDAASWIDLTYTGYSGSGPEGYYFKRITASDASYTEAEKVVDNLVIAGGSGVSSAATTPATVNTLTISADHDAITNFVGDEHVAHSGVTLTAGTGLGGGGTIAANRTFNLDTPVLLAHGGTAATSFTASQIVQANAGATALESTGLTHPNIVPGGVLSEIVISDDGGLAISWSTGKIYDPAGNIVEIEAGNDTCTDDAINCLIWVSGTTLTLGTTPPDIVAGEVCCGSIACQNGDIWNVHQQPLINQRVPFGQASMADTLSIVVANGLLVSEDADATNTHDVKSAVGVYHHDMHDIHTVAAIVSRTTPLVRWWRTAGAAAWSHDSNAEIDVTQYDQDGVGLTAAGAKYCRGLWLVAGTSPPQLHYVFPQAAYNTEAQGVAGRIPTIPPGLALFPKSTTYVFKGGEAAMAALGTGRWADVRPQIGAPALGGMITTHLSLTDIGTNTHAQIDTHISSSALTCSTVIGDHHLVVGSAGISRAVQECVVSITPATGVVAGITTLAASTLLQTPLLIGGAAANATLLLTASGHGAPTGDVIDFKTEGSRLMRLSGDVTSRTHALVLGAAVPVDGYADRIIVTTDAWFSVLACYAHSNTNTHHPSFRIARSRGTAAVPAAVLNGDTIGTVSFNGYTDDYYGRARIDCVVDGAPSASTSIPMALLFKTGTTSLVESFRVMSDRNIRVYSAQQLQFSGATEYIQFVSAAMKMNSSARVWLRAPTVECDATTLIRLSNSGTAKIEIDALKLTFKTGGDEPTIYWPSASNAFLGVGVTRRLSWSTTGLGFHTTAPVAKQDIVGARDVPEEAFADLLTKLALTGLFTDSTTAS